MAKEKQGSHAAAKLPHRPVTAVTDPRDVHGDEVDLGGPSLAALAHHNAKAICDALGIPCGSQANLPEGICLACWEPCPYAPEGGSGRPYATDEVASAVEAAGGKTPLKR